MQQNEDTETKQEPVSEPYASISPTQGYKVSEYPKPHLKNQVIKVAAIKATIATVIIYYASTASSFLGYKGDDKIGISVFIGLALAILVDIYTILAVFKTKKLPTSTLAVINALTCLFALILFWGTIILNMAGCAGPTCGWAFLILIPSAIGFALSFLPLMCISLAVKWIINKLLRLRR